MRPFNKSLDLEQVQAWMPGLDPELVPETGLIEDGVAVVFFYHTAGKALLVDCLVDNPSARRVIVVKSIVSGVAEVLKYAKETGVRTLIVPSRFPSITRAFRKAGAKGQVVPLDLCYIFPEL